MRSHTLPGFALPLAGGDDLQRARRARGSRAGCGSSPRTGSRRRSVLAGCDRVLAWVTWLAAALVVVALFAGPKLIGRREGRGRRRRRRPPAADPGAGRLRVLAARAATRSRRRARPAPSGRTSTNASPTPPAVVGDRDRRAAARCRRSRGQLSAEPRSRPWPSTWRPARAADAARASGPRRSLAPLLAAVLVAGLRGAGLFDDEDAPAIAAATPTADGDGDSRGRRASRPRPRSAPAAGRTASRSPTTASSGSPTPRRRRTVAQISAPRRASTGDRDPTPGAQPDSPVVADGVLWVGRVAPTMPSAGSTDGRHPRRFRVGRAPESLAVGGAFMWVTNARRRHGDAASTAPRARSSAGRSASAAARWTSPSTGTLAWVTSFDDGTVTPHRHRIRQRSSVSRSTSAPAARRGRRRGLGVGRQRGRGHRHPDRPGRRQPSSETRSRSATTRASSRSARARCGSPTRATTPSPRIDPLDGTVVGDPIATGDDPTGIAVGAGAVWTANFRDGTVTRIEP